MDIFFKLLLAHLIGDFLLQWRNLLSHKFEKKFLSPYLYLHGFIHFALGMIFVWDISWLVPMVIIAASHTVIDGLKVSFTNEENERILFFIDQILHIVILLAAWAFVTGSSIDLISSVPNFWLHICALFFVTFPASISIRIFFSKWELPKSGHESLVGVGANIGYIERILIYIAVVTGQWNLVGFIVAAKSVFRFSDFNKPEERKYAEYLFLGTLLSMCIAILAGLLVMGLTGKLTIS